MMSSANAPVPSTAEIHDKTAAVAVEAAETAQHTLPPPKTHGPTGTGHVKESFEEFEREIKETTDHAVADGKEDVTNATASYLEKALHIADTGLSTAQSYVGAGKEHLAAPHQGANPPTGLAASLAATAASALDAISSGLGMAHTQLHANAPGTFQHHPSTAVTTPAKPIGQALSDNVTAVQAAAQPHIDAAKSAAQPHIDAAKSAAQPHIDNAQATVQPHVDAAMASAQPHIDNAQAAVQPHIDAAKAAAQPHIDAAKSTYNDVQTSDKSYVQQAQEFAQPHVDAAKSTVNDIQSSDKSYTQQAQEFAQPHIDNAKASVQSTYAETTPSSANPMLEQANADHPGVEAAKPQSEYPTEVKDVSNI
jgi:gas vesicle protein